MATFDPWQQVFSLSMLVHGLGQLKGPTVSQLQALLADRLRTDLENPELRALIGEAWWLAWGPCVHLSPHSGVPDSAIAVLHDAATGLYVVAVAGADFHALFDAWTDEGNVRPIQRWPYADVPTGLDLPEGVAIAPCVETGVDILLTQRDASGRSLAAFLRQVRNPRAALVVTGHGLGGALASTLACALVTQGQLDRHDWGQVYVVPSAAPTPGNAAFAELFAQFFPLQVGGTLPWQVWNGLLWNDLDLVTHAWADDRLAEIPALYATRNIHPNHAERAILALGRHRASRQGYQALPSTSLPGTIDPHHATFRAQAHFQHVDAYFELLQVEALQTVLQRRPVLAMNGD